MADNPEKETFNSDKVRDVPKETMALAQHAAVDLINLASLQQVAPPQVQQAIEQIGKTMMRLAMHVFATLEEGKECARRIEARRDKMEQDLEQAHGQRAAQQQDASRGAIMHQMFGGPARNPIGFRPNQEGDKHVS